MAWQQSHLVITGLMGSGKTAVGIEVSRRLRLPFSDSDVAITTQTGFTGRQISERDGVETLHDLEARHVLDALTGAPAVIAAAASVLDDPDSLRVLAAVRLVFLDVAPSVLAERLAAGAHRRWLADPVGELTAMRERRLPAAREAGAVVIEEGGRTVAQIATDVVAMAG